MGLRKRQTLYNIQRDNAIRRFHKQRRVNLLAPEGEYKYIIVLDHLKPTYNVGKIFRSADAFGACEVHLIGIDYFDPAPAKGSFKWVPARFFDNFDKCYQNLTKRGYTIYTMEPDSGSPLLESAMPELSAFVFGHEEFGISFDKSDYPGLQSISIPQYGRVQSLNVSIAASIVMYEYIRQHQE